MSAATAYADRLGMGLDEADWFCGLIASLDGEYLKFVAAQKPKQPKQE